MYPVHITNLFNGVPNGNYGIIKTTVQFDGQSALPDTPSPYQSVKSRVCYNNNNNNVIIGATGIVPEGLKKNLERYQESIQ
jgi:hypothetical protein